MCNLANQTDIYDITPFTALDFPDHLAAIFWFTGCNLACKYCYNPHIVRSKGRISADEAFAFLRSRVGLLDGVVLSGGEATGCKKIVDYAREIKDLGFKIKLDTNGTNPTVLDELLRLDLIDFVAIDFKAPKEKWRLITNRSNDGFDMFGESLKILQKSGTRYEVRTTYHSELLDPIDLQTMVEHLRSSGYDKPFFVQQFVDTQTLERLPDSKILEICSNDIKLR